MMRRLAISTLTTFIGVATLSLAVGCEDEPDVDAGCRDLAPGHTCTWVGLRSEEGYNGDGHHRRETLINQPQDLLFLPDGTAWFTDFNNFLIRRINADGTIETMVGSTDPIFPGDGPWGGLVPGGAEGSEWLLNHPTNLLLQPDGNVLVVAWHNHKLLTVDPKTGFVQVVCGGGAGFAGDGMLAAKAALFKQLNDATFDEAGNLYIIDQQNARVRMIDAAGIITTIAGDGTLGHSGDGGPALMAQFSWARGSNPNPSGGIVYHQGKLYISDTEADVIRVMDLALGTVDAFAGTGEEGDAGDDGPALAAKLSGPRDLEIGPDGDLYFADTDNGKVRAIDLEAGIIRTVVGTGELGVDDRDGLPATETRLRRPFGIAFDPDGDLYVMDTLNSRIVKVAL
jgi:DNA-binding beta-propeller fold protein YncE